MVKTKHKLEINKTITMTQKETYINLFENFLKKDSLYNKFKNNYEQGALHETMSFQKFLKEAHPLKYVVQAFDWAKNKNEYYLWDSIENKWKATLENFVMPKQIDFKRNMITIKRSDIFSIQDDGDFLYLKFANPIIK